MRVLKYTGKYLACDITLQGLNDSNMYMYFDMICIYNIYNIIIYIYIIL